MLHTVSPYARQECANCHAHTRGPLCGCCGSPHLQAVPDAPAILPPAENAAVIKSAAVPFTLWSL